MIKGITFDIDTTLTYEVSWYLLTQKLGADPEQHRSIFTDMLAGKISYHVAKTRLIHLWQETGKANKIYFTKIFQEISLKNNAKEIIDYVKSKDIIVCLLTGSVDLYAEVIASRLDVRNYYANTQLIWDDKENLIDFNYERQQGAKKLEQLKDFCIKFHLSKNDIFIVGDDENDIELFTYTNHGIAVASPTSHKLDPYAWKKITALPELKQLL